MAGNFGRLLILWYLADFTLKVGLAFCQNDSNKIIYVFGGTGWLEGFGGCS